MVGGPHVWAFSKWDALKRLEFRSRHVINLQEDTADF
jgi:hypothetical protein